MPFKLSDPLCNFPIEVIEEKDANEVNGAPCDGDGETLAQYPLAVIAHEGECNVHGHSVDDDANNTGEDHQGQHNCNCQPGENQFRESRNKY